MYTFEDIYFRVVANDPSVEERIQWATEYASYGCTEAWNKVASFFYGAPILPKPAAPEVEVVDLDKCHVVDSLTGTLVNSNLEIPTMFAVCSMHGTRCIPFHIQRISSFTLSRRERDSGKIGVKHIRAGTSPTAAQVSKRSESYSTFRHAIQREHNVLPNFYIDGRPFYDAATPILFSRALNKQIGFMKKNGGYLLAVRLDGEYYDDIYRQLTMLPPDGTSSGSSNSCPLSDDPMSDTSGGAPAAPTETFNPGSPSYARPATSSDPFYRPVSPPIPQRLKRPSTYDIEDLDKDNTVEATPEPTAPDLTGEIKRNRED